MADIGTFTFKQIGIDTSTEARRVLLAGGSEIDFKARLAAISRAAQLELRQALSRLVTGEPMLTEQFYYGSEQLGVYPVMLYHIDPAARMVLYGTMICTKAELRSVQSDNPAKILLPIGQANSRIDSHFPPTMPPSARPDDEGKSS